MKKKGREKLFSPRPRKEKKKRRGCSFVVVVASVPLPFPSLLPIFRPRTNTHLCLARRRGNDAELANPRKQTMKQQKYNNAVYLHLRFRIFLKATFVGSHTLMTDGQCQPFFSSPPPSIPHPNSPLNPQQSVRSWATLPSPISPDIISLHCELDLGQTPLSFLFLSPAAAADAL